MRNIGASMGVSFVTTFVARRSQFHQSVLAAHVTPFSQQVQQYLGGAREMFFQNGSDRSAAGSRSLASLYGMVQQQAALLSFTEAFRIMAILFLAVVPLVLLMRRSRVTRRAEVVE
jgi:DHA2 family multidrug resistance protein